MSAAVSIYINDHTPSGQSRLYRVTQLRTDGVHCRESVVSKHNHCAVLLLYVLWTRFFLPTYVCTSVESLVYTVQYYMLFQNIPGYDVLLLYAMDRFLPSRLMPVSESRN